MIVLVDGVLIVRQLFTRHRIVIDFLWVSIETWPERCRGSARESHSIRYYCPRPPPLAANATAPSTLMRASTRCLWRSSWHCLDPVGRCSSGIRLLSTPTEESR